VTSAPPAAIMNLNFSAGRTTGALAWTAPDDGNGGPVVGYDVRWSSGPITDELFWNSANPVDSNGPQPPGTPECLDLNLAQCSPYYWAIKSVDIHGVWSPLSNTSGATTRCINGREVACALAPEGPPSDRPALPRALAIGDITPNPARTPVVLPLAIPAGFSDSDIRLSIFDVTGRLIRTLDAGRAEPGYRDITWDLRDSGGALSANGVYFVRVALGRVVENRRLLLVR